MAHISKRAAFNSCILFPPFYAYLSEQIKQEYGGNVEMM
ncbi:hypothetical protein C2W64_00890 [Brevibacillus laterosporus]|nr:hypothetical protein C2W64_00890 [Brevibacillus laterosporus]